MPSSDKQTIHRPSRARVEKLAAEMGLNLNSDEIDDYYSLINGTLGDIEQVVEADDPRFEIHETQYTDRSPGYRPGSDEDPYNAWITKCTVEGADSGPLSGMEIGLKDNVALAGYEMTCGSSVLEGYVPQIDATVATRLLEAGATITGKLNMESFAFSGSSDTSDFGTVETPHAEGYLTGGSSSGSGAAPAAGDCDAAIGGDQGDRSVYRARGPGWSVSSRRQVSFRTPVFSPSIEGTIILAHRHGLSRMRRLSWR